MYTDKSFLIYSAICGNKIARLEGQEYQLDIRMPPHSPSPVIQSAPRNDPHVSAPSTTAHEAAITATIGNTILDDAILNLHRVTTSGGPKRKEAHE